MISNYILEKIETSREIGSAIGLTISLKGQKMALKNIFLFFRDQDEDEDDRG